MSEATCDCLDNGNYVVRSLSWDNGTVSQAGSVTWGNGSTGTSGTVSASNSLVGTSNDDRVGFGGVIALNNGNYVFSSQYWDNGTAVEAGSVTWVTVRQEPAAMFLLPIASSGRVTMTVSDSAV